MTVHDTAWADGTPCWIDYSATDVGAAQAFYADVLGWTFDDGDPQYGGYLTCRRDGHAAAGMMPKMAPDQPSAWTTYFAASDAAAAAERVTAAGGSIIAPPMAVGPLGTMVVALDPQGCAFGLWQAAQFIGTEIVNEPGGLVWTEAAVPDPAAARTFYCAVLGFAYDEVEGAPDYTTFRTGERPLGGLGGTSPGSPTGWTACFSVASADDAVAAVERGGGKVTISPTDMPYGRYAVVADPWGAPFSLMQEPAS